AFLLLHNYTDFIDKSMGTFSIFVINKVRYQPNQN
ncbi:TPA: erythromycin resistance leader peptide, partial [Staphylococcus aureus]|nr:erythromycin resistance leader peptide [Staphylococcus aureus]